MPNPFISILTVSKNMSTTIIETCESLKRQTFTSIEHVVIDGDSEDNTKSILEKFSKSYDMKWLSEPDNGISEALNKAINLATGYYISVIQADDRLLTPQTLAKVSSYAVKYDADIMSFPVFMYRPRIGKIQRKPIRHLWWNRFKFIFPHQGCFVKRSVFDKIGVFNTSFKIAMDYDFFYRALKHNCLVKFGEEPVAFMGGSGIGSIVETAPQRLREEQMVQAINEDNYYWRTAQKIFWWLYMPYKKKQLRRSY